MGTRDVGAARARTEPGHAAAEALGPWLDAHPDVQLVTFPDAVAGSEILINATNGAASVEVLHAANLDDFEGKILIDLGNPLDFSSGQLE